MPQNAVLASIRTHVTTGFRLHLLSEQMSRMTLINIMLVPILPTSSLLHSLCNIIIILFFFILVVLATPCCCKSVMRHPGGRLVIFCGGRRPTTTPPPTPPSSAAVVLLLRYFYGGSLCYSAGCYLEGRGDLASILISFTSLMITPSIPMNNLPKL